MAICISEPTGLISTLVSKHVLCTMSIKSILEMKQSILLSLPRWTGTSPLMWHFPVFAGFMYISVFTLSGVCFNYSISIIAVNSSRLKSLIFGWSSTQTFDISICSSIFDLLIQATVIFYVLSLAFSMCSAISFQKGRTM